MLLVDVALRHPRARVRGRVALAVASLDLPCAVPALKKAIDREPVAELKGDMQQVLDQLLETAMDNVKRNGKA